MILIFSATTECNLRCKHCFRSGSGPDSLDISVIKNIIKQSLKYGISLIGFTGGEFTMHPQFKEILDFVHDEVRIPYSIVSNGFAFDDAFNIVYPHRDQVAFIAFSIDGPNAEVHDNIRGHGSFERATSNLKKCYDSGIHTRVCMAIGNHNIDYVEEMAMTVLKCGVCEMVYTTVLPAPNNGDLVLSRPDRRKLHMRILALQQQIATPIIMGINILGVGGVSHCCATTMDSITVDAWGNLVFCCELADYSSINNSKDEVICSLLDTSLDEGMCMYSDMIHKFRCDKIKSLELLNDPYYYSSCFYCVDYFNKKVDV